MKGRIELLAPGGDMDSIKAAIAGGADAIYCGLQRFSARNRAANITLGELNAVLRLAHRHDCKVFLTLNITIVESDIPGLIDLLNKLVNTSIDGVIVQDLGLFHLLSQHFKRLKAHASTQLTTHNEGQIRFLSKLAARRVNLSRELSIREIEPLASAGHEEDISIEVFVHGSYCISFSGICYMSSVIGGNSGNRGRCSQPCRSQYQSTRQGKNFPLNLKDNSAFFDLRALSHAGVDAIKIEGRMKNFPYVYTVTNVWSNQLQGFYRNNETSNDDSELYKVFNRDFSNAYLMGEIDKSMFIDHPRNNSATHLRDKSGRLAEESETASSVEPYGEIAEIQDEVKQKIQHLSSERTPLTLCVSGDADAPLKASVITPDGSFTVMSDALLTPQSKKTGAQQLNHDLLLDKFKPVNETAYFIERLNLESLQSGLFLPFKELTLIRKRILLRLNGGRDTIEPVVLPALPAQRNTNSRPELSVLISSLDDLDICNDARAELDFQLPNCMSTDYDALADLFIKNRSITPWFPAVLVGEDFSAAVEFLLRVNPERIVTNNTGIAYEAHKARIPWIAGPQLNIANSYSLACLYESSGCRGSYISNELSKFQIKRIRPPAGLELCYSIYHPIVLLTSRQCLFHQVTGCERDTFDDSCLRQCKKSASITDKKMNTFFIEKTEGNFSSIYNGTNFLNTDILADMPHLFSRFLIDLRDIATGTKVELGKSKVVTLFETFLGGGQESIQALQESITPTTNVQYRKGI